MDDFKDVLRELAIIGLPLAVAIVIGAAIGAAIGAPIAWLQASQEAAAFNRFTTGPKATTWDALWVELRVEADR